MCLKRKSVWINQSQRMRRWIRGVGIALTKRSERSSQDQGIQDPFPCFPRSLYERILLTARCKCQRSNPEWSIQQVPRISIVPGPSTRRSFSRVLILMNRYRGNRKRFSLKRVNSSSATFAKDYGRSSRIFVKPLLVKRSAAPGRH